jgi:hypothetical protein
MVLAQCFDRMDPAGQLASLDLTTQQVSQLQVQRLSEIQTDYDTLPVLI